MNRRLSFSLNLLLIGLAVAICVPVADACWTFKKRCRCVQVYRGCPQNNGLYPIGPGDFQTAFNGGRAMKPLKRIHSVFVLTSKDRFAGPILDPETGMMTRYRKPVCRDAEKKMKGFLEDAAGRGSEQLAELMPPIILKDDEATPDNAKRAIESLQVTPSDCLVFFYSGHGSAQNGRHMLSSSYFETEEATDAKWHLEVSHSEVRDWIVRKHPGLAVILTSSCANEIALEQVAAAAAAEDPAPIYPARDLFLFHRGLVDINGCSYDETTVTRVFMQGIDETLKRTPTNEQAL